MKERLREGKEGENGRCLVLKYIETPSSGVVRERAMWINACNAVFFTLKGFNLNNPGQGGTVYPDVSGTQPGESDERTEKAHLQS